jgi:hypothetical protein
MKTILALTTTFIISTSGLLGSTLDAGNQLFALQTFEPSTYGVIGATFLGIMVLVRRRELRKS